MNRTNLQTLIDALRTHTLAEQKDVGFNMSTYIGRPNLWRDQPMNTDHSGRNCGTVACIAGHAAWLATDADEVRDIDLTVVPDLAKKWLGLDEYTARELFLGGYSRPDSPEFLDYLTLDQLSAVTLDQAIAVLEHLRDTGAVNWPKALGWPTGAPPVTA